MSKTNKLSVYLIKEEYPDADSILKNSRGLESQDIEGVGTLYLNASRAFEPSWVKDFFGGIDLALPMRNSSSKALLLAPISVDKDKKRTFALSFGYGRSLMNEGVWEERFGLKVTLNTVDAKSVRSIEKQNMASVPKHTTEQMSRDGEVGDFGIDIEQDLVRAVTGASTRKRFGKMLTGKDALSVSVKVDLASVVGFLQECWEQYTSDAYKQDFGFIDQIAELKDPRLLDRLNIALVGSINEDRLDKTWMAVPEVIDWADVKGFKYSTAKKTESSDDIHVREFVASLSEKKRGAVELQTLKGHRVYCISADRDDVMHSWRVYDCLYCEVVDTQSKKVYLLSNGKWYEVETDFATIVTGDYEALRDAGSTVALPTYESSDEYAYNQAVAEEDPSFCCMDRKNIPHGGGYSKIEFCDLFKNDQKIVHVKHYAGSSVLSHLFSQGVVSGELFLADSKFRRKVNEKLIESHKLNDPLAQPVARDYEVVFAVISKSKKNLDLPFFSKVSLRNARRRLQTFGYSVSFQKIDVIDPFAME